MNQNTRLKFNAMLQALASQYNVEDPTRTFSVTPSAAQTITAKTKEEIDFLGKINVAGVKAQKGEAIGLNATGMIASTTDTSAGDRTPRDVLGMSGTPYLLEQVNFDTYIKHQTLDAWAHKPNFKGLVAQQIRRQIGLNKISIGWYGESRAATSDPVANPKGEDVAKGWIQKLREQYAENFLAEGGTTGQIRIGEGGDYINLDEAVNDVKQMIDAEFEDDADLVVIVGSELLAAERAKFYAAHGNTPTEKAKIEDQQVIGSFGGLPAYKVPQFPGRGIVVTSFDNLSIYYQEDSIRRRIEENSKRDRIETYQSENIDFVIEQLGKMAAVEFKNVKLTNDGGTTWI